MIYWIKRFVGFDGSSQLSTIIVVFIFFSQLPTVNCQLSTELGLILDDAAYESVPLKKKELKRSYSSLPDKVDLRVFAPPVQDQGKTNTCTGWALGYAACTIQEASINKIITPTDIETIATSPDFVYINGKAADVEGCSAPMKTEDILKNIVGQPIPRKKEFNKYCAGTAALKTASGSGVVIKNYARLFSFTDPWQYKIDQIRKVLADNRPVIVGMRLFKSFKNVKDVWDGKDDGYLGSHALCIVGYDNNFLGGAFEVMNSWGTNWGDQGFAWMSYETLQKTQSLHSAFEITIEKSTQLSAFSSQGQESGIPQPKSEIPNPISDKFTSNIYFKLDDNSPIPTSIKTASRGLIVVKNDSSKNSNETSVETRHALSPSNQQETRHALSLPQTTNFLNFVTQKSYSSGTKYRAFVEVSHPTYLYVLGSDLSGDFSVLFPSNANTSEFLSSKGTAIALPDENSSIQMDNTIGKDFMYFIYSYKKIDAAALISELNSKKGDASQKLASRFKSALSKSTPIEKLEKNMSFNSDNAEEKFFIISLEIDHK